MTAETTPDPSNEAFGRHLRALREQRGLNQVQLAERAGLELEVVVQVEDGEVSAPLAVLRGLAGALGVRLSELFDDNFESTISS